MVKIEATVPQAEYLKLLQQCRQAGEMLRSLTESLTQATQQIKDQAALIERLSKDNLALVARIESITKITCPNAPFAA